MGRDRYRLPPNKADDVIRNHSVTVKLKERVPISRATEFRKGNASQWGDRGKGPNSSACRCRFRLQRFNIGEVLEVAAVIREELCNATYEHRCCNLKIENVLPTRFDGLKERNPPRRYVFGNREQYNVLIAEKGFDELNRFYGAVWSRNPLELVMVK